MASSIQSKKDLNTPVQYVKGIGPKRAEALAERGIRTVHDLLYYFPFDYIDLSKVETIGNLKAVMDTGKWITVIGTVRTFDLVGRPPRQRCVVVLEDATGTISLVFFRSVNFFKKAFTVGEQLAVSGKVTGFRNRPQIIHPSLDRLSGGDEEDNDLQGFLHTRGIVPKYGSTEDLKNVHLNVKGLRRVMKSAVDEYVGSIDEPLPVEIRKRNILLTLREALTAIHFPESHEQLQEARKRLKFDELFFMQLLLAINRKSVKTDLPGISFGTKNSFVETLIRNLPFTLTKAQARVIKEITADMHSARPMNRLLQGDVGSGKTIVALVAMLVAVENGYQAAFMAPTEILAEQHYRTLANSLKDISVNIRLLIGGQRTKLREDILEDVRRGSAQIIVGTHALIQEAVEYARLGLVIIDEQHRFGVTQRIALKEKSRSASPGTPYPDVLVMTATPIPRTLSLTLYGDLDVSTIDELPANRRPIKTALRTESQHDAVFSFLRDQTVKGEQSYIVYPLVEESEKLDLKAATESFEHLKSDVFPDLRLGLIHGRMSSSEKDEVMMSFKNRTTDILVATTVIEVGIDVPTASTMVIEHAERFGLSQLHQLRGRVGRGAEQSYCILMTPDWMGKRLNTTQPMPDIDGEEAERWKSGRRLKAMLDTSDGFKIAEIDLELRGPGEFFGTRQSGLPALQLANLVTDGALLTDARREAFDIIETDPHLRSPDHLALRKYYDDRLRDAMTLVQIG